MFSGRLHCNEAAQAVMTHPWSSRISFHDHLALDQFFQQALDIGLDLAYRRSIFIAQGDGNLPQGGAAVEPIPDGRPVSFRLKMAAINVANPRHDGHNQQLASMSRAITSSEAT